MNLPKTLLQQDKKEMIAWYERELEGKNGRHVWNVLKHNRILLEGFSRDQFADIKVEV